MHVIFGPSDGHLAGHVESVCESVGMPLLLTVANRGADAVRRHFVMDIFPVRKHLGRAFRDLIEFLNWTKTAIVYDDEESEYARGRVRFKKSPIIIFVTVMVRTVRGLRYATDSGVYKQKIN